jgi:putative methionine-R-sulfoxide reductase with GAF domain/predicted Ser/Thr protein kinase
MIGGDGAFGASPGLVIGDRYRLIDRLSEGGMGAVFRAQDTDTGEEVAVKQLLDTRFATQFEIEARLLAVLHHPRVVRVFGHHQTDDGSYLVMEKIEGDDLGGVLKRRGSPGLAVDEALEFVLQACEALQYVHEQQIVHLDVKPQNLIAGGDGVVLVDFGIATELQTATAAAGMGTRSFMAPEVFAGSGASPRSDVFGLAACLWTLLTGRPPVYGERQRLVDLVPDAGPELEETVRAGLELLPDRRIASAEAFARALGSPLVRAGGESLARSILAPSLPRQLIEAVVRTAAGVFEAAAASIALIDETTRELVYQAAWGAGAQEIVGVRLPLGQGIAGTVAATGAGIAVSECRNDSRFAAQIAAGTGYVPVTMAVVPLRSEGATIGVLSILDRRSGEPYRSEDLPRAELFADLAVSALELAPAD